MKADLVLAKVTDEYRCTFRLPDPTSERREMAMNKLRSLGCTVFNEYRHYDTANDYEAITIQGFRVVLLQTFDSTPSQPVGWSVG